MKPSQRMLHPMLLIGVMVFPLAWATPVANQATLSEVEEIPGTWCGMMVACGDQTHANCAPLLGELGGAKCRRDLEEQHAVRCCSDTELEGFSQQNGCSVLTASHFFTNWGTGDGEAGTDWSDCYHKRTWRVAENICTGAGARLCARNEIESQCTQGTGCGHDGDLVWTSTGNACQANPCSQQGDPTAMCVETGAPYTEFSCTCSPGYSGEFCAEVPCPSNSTQHGGGDCKCDAGYDGTVSWDTTTVSYVGACVDADGCVGSPCNQRGDDSAKCIDMPAPDRGFTCMCSFGFTGAKCDFHGCAGKPCNQHGDTGALCADIVDVPGGYTCTCAPGSTGDVCTEVPCPDHSSITSPGECTCDDGFSGAITWGGQEGLYVGGCISTQPCVNNPCTQRGDSLALCVDMLAPAKGSMCTCSAGFSGPFCSPLEQGLAEPVIGPPDGLVEPDPIQEAVGGTRDEHGCIAAAGYMWDGRRCARPWESTSSIMVDPSVTQPDADTSDKTTWPELVGVAGEVAVATIKAERSDLQQVMTISEDSMMTMDYRLERVRVMVNAEGNVSKPPNCG